MKTAKISESNITTVLIAASLILLAVLTFAGFFVGSLRFAGSILAGGLLAILNFCWLRSVLVRTLSLQPHNATRFVLVRYVARLAVLAVAVYALIVYCRADVFGLLIGLSVLVFNIMFFSVYMISAKGD